MKDHETTNGTATASPTAATSDAATSTNAHLLSCVACVQETLSRADLLELERLIIDGKLSRTQTRDWISERNYRLANWVIDKFRAAIITRLVTIRDDVDDADEELRAARRNGVSGSLVLFESVMLKIAQSHREKLSVREPEKPAKETDWTQTLTEMGKAVRIMKDLKACKRDESARSSQKSARVRTAPKKTAAEEQAEALAAGPELVARMERILNL